MVDVKGYKVPQMLLITGVAETIMYSTFYSSLAHNGST